jgi:hypothetical protein
MAQVCWAISFPPVARVIVRYVTRSHLYGAGEWLIWLSLARLRKSVLVSSVSCCSLFLFLYVLHGRHKGEDVARDTIQGLVPKILTHEGL